MSQELIESFVKERMYPALLKSLTKAVNCQGSLRKLVYVFKRGKSHCLLEVLSKII